MNTSPDSNDNSALDDARRIVDELEHLVESSPAVPLTQNRILDEDRFFIATVRLKSLLDRLAEESKTVAPGNRGVAAAGPSHCLRRDDTLLLIVDVQERLMPSIHEAARVEANCALLARAARQLGLPLMLTEQYPEKLGPTTHTVREAAGFPPAIGKLRFSACTEATLPALESSGRKTVLLCGVEAHVCVLQTALDLRTRGYHVFVARDAISSRTPENAHIGWERMLQAGAMPTSTESAVFELLEEAGTADFKAMLPLIK